MIMTEQQLNTTEAGLMSWYVVHVYSGFEAKVKLSIEERFRNLKKESFLGEVVVPEENVVELVKGQKKTTKKKFLPGYILVKMNLTEEILLKCGFKYDGLYYSTDNGKGFAFVWEFEKLIFTN
jgi:hypothetical protein